MEFLVPLLLLLAAIPTLPLLRRLIESWRQWQALKHLPHPPSSDTLAGSTELITDLDRVSQILGAETDKLGGLMSFRIFHIPSIIVTDPELVEQLLPLPKNEPIYRIFSCLTSPDGRTPNMLSHLTNDGYWHRVRKGTAPAFNTRNLKAEFPHLLEVVDRLSAVLTNFYMKNANAAGQGGYVDMDNLLQRESLDVIGKMGFGTDFGATKLEEEEEEENNNSSSASSSSSATLTKKAHNKTKSVASQDTFAMFRAAALEVAKRWNSAFRQPLRHILPDARRGSQDLLQVQARMKVLLNEVREKYGNVPPPPSETSIAAHLLRITPPLTEEELVGEFALFFFAGFETTGHTLAWTLYLLARHPGALAEVLTQLDEMKLLKTASRSSPRSLEYNDVSALHGGALGRCVNESMRLLSVVSGGTARQTKKPMTLRGYTIPAHVQIFLIIDGLHHGARNWERPFEFEPDRWRQPGTAYWKHPLVNDSRGSIGGGGGGIQGDVQGEEGGVRGGEGGRGRIRQPPPPSPPPPSAEALFNELDKPTGGDISKTTSKHLPRRFLPFSGGARGCIGQELAKMNIATTLAVLLSNFEFRLPAELESDAAQWELQTNRITNSPDWKGRGLPMKVIPRGAGGGV